MSINYLPTKPPTPSPKKKPPTQTPPNPLTRPSRKIPAYNLRPNFNTGDDLAGTIHSVGSKIYEFRPGDRVATFHEMMTPGGSFAEYAIGCQHTTFHLPPNVSYEAGATLPLAAMTAAIGLHLRLGLPHPWTPVPDGQKTPLLVYGGASAVGAYAIQLASLANLHPIIAIAGRGATFVEGLIDRGKGDTIVDYRNGDERLIQDIRSALGDSKLRYAFDAVSEKGSYRNICKVLERTGRLTLVLPVKEEGVDSGIPESVDRSVTMVGEAHKGDKEFAYVMFKYMVRGLAQGWFRAHPFEVVEGGLETGVEKGLRWLQEGRNSGCKYVFRIGDA
ncbi:hypothetical protein BDW02DRAFT_566390 [Decorospora gaudefroyi]|uniref:Enoyl reductase (ER) domain-containing protein n=1 Tax=Decorospora gaudefroyi TaxID=184978 RepID=A0A6A5KLY4_9PLEO|nr:hypothetical protein BDW02DRAFT_566390 [Decorospora gaudefroyi]